MKRATRSLNARYFLADGWLTPVVAYRNSAFWRWMSRWIPLMKVHTVGWWHWNSDCSPWCHPSTLLVLRAIPSDPAACWFQVATGNAAGRPRRLRPRMCVRRTKSARPDERQLLAATQQEVRMPPPRRMAERKQAREDSGRSCEFRRWFRTPSSVLSRSLCELRSDRGGNNSPSRSRLDTVKCRPVKWHPVICRSG